MEESDLKASSSHSVWLLGEQKTIKFRQTNTKVLQVGRGAAEWRGQASVLSQKFPEPLPQEEKGR